MSKAVCKHYLSWLYGRGQYIQKGHDSDKYVTDPDVSLEGDIRDIQSPIWKETEH